MERTKKRVIDAFAHLARERSYDSIRVGDVLRGAEVGRSTFYSHYRGKDDVLVQALSMFYGILADCLDETLRGTGDARRLECLLEHFHENRLLFRRLTTGAAAEPFARSIVELGRLFEQRLERYCADHDRSATLPLSRLAAVLSHAQLALLREWLIGTPSSGESPTEVAVAMTEFTRAAAGALLPHGSSR